MIETICNDIYRLFLLKRKKTNRELYKMVRKLDNYFVRHPMDSRALKCVINLEEKIIASNGPYKTFIEKNILEAISSKACFSIIEHDTALNLSKFMRKIFKHKKPRDNFSSKRKAIALEILIHLSDQHEIPDPFDLCQESLKSNKTDLVISAIEFYKNHYKEHGKKLDKDTIKLLDKTILRTKDRSVAVCALNIQVETGHISELGALSRIDEWKEKNLYL